jgi:hypothetical protein
MDAKGRLGMVFPVDAGAQETLEAGDNSKFPFCFLSAAGIFEVEKVLILKNTLLRAFISDYSGFFA